MNKVSIIIPVLNEAAIMKTRLEAMQCLRDAGADLILVDGGSTDATVQESLGLVDHVVHSEKGRAVQMSAGADIAAGDVFWFVHADSVLTYDLCQSSIDVLKNMPDGWGFHRVSIDGAGVLLKLVAGMMNFRSRLTSVATGDQGIFISSNVYHAIGGFGSEPLMEDVRISKLLRSTGRPLIAPGFIGISARKWETDGAWRTILMMWRLRLLYFLGASPEKLVKQYYRNEKS